MPDRVVEVAGIEPASVDTEPGLLRVQYVTGFSRPRRSYAHVRRQAQSSKSPASPPDKMTQRAT